MKKYLKPDKYKLFGRVDKKGYCPSEDDKSIRVSKENGRKIVDELINTRAFSDNVI